MRRVAGLLLIASCLIGLATPAEASSGIVIGLWPQNFAQYQAIQANAGIPIPYFRGRMRDGQFDSNLVGNDAHTAANLGLSLGLNIQPKTGSGNNRTGIPYSTISAQIQAHSGSHYDKLVSFANEVLALPTYGVVPNYIQFHSEANVQNPPPDSQPYSGTSTEYQQCFALIHQLFQQLGVTNKIYWQIVLTQKAYALNQAAAWYPSDPSTYDYVGVDAYYRFANPNNPLVFPWISPSAAFGPALSFAQALGKPIWIDEVGADEGGPTGSVTAKAQWFSALDTYLEANLNFVAGVVFSNASDGGNWFLDSKYPYNPNAPDQDKRTVPNYTGTTWDGWKAAVTSLASARFTRSLTVNSSGSGTGMVASTPSGIACPGDCAETVHLGDAVHLEAAADPGSVFMGWTGDCAGSGTACDLTIDESPDVTATFEQLHDLSVATDGAGTGSVTSDVGGITCPPATCTASGLVHGSHVILTAAPDAGSSFAGWSGGGCNGTAPICDVAMNGDTTVAATFTGSTDLSITLTGSGGGAVTSTPTAIDCPGTCTGGFATGGEVSLHAQADGSSLFAGWNSLDPGFDCPGTVDCTVTMDQTRSVEASFQHANRLQVQRSGIGPGTVTSDVPGIDCGTTCDHLYADGAVVVLHADDGANALFEQWSGDCTGTDDCIITMDQARTVTATFDPIYHELQVAKDGSGTGTVTSLAPDVGVSCGTACEVDYVQGTSVVLHAVADAGSSVFSGWNGGGCAGTSDCAVTMDAPHAVTATFTQVQHLLTVGTAGSGTGSVTSDLGGIACPGACGQTYSNGTPVQLTVTTGANSTFTGWSGACIGAGTCVVTMDTAKNVIATFALVPRALTATTAGNGAGTVSSNPVGITCPATCVASYDHGAVVGLTAITGANSTFAGWSGACTGRGPCSVTMDAAKSVTATFDNPPQAVPDSAPAVAYDGWAGLADPQAQNGFVRNSDVKNDTATWKSPPTTSIKWLTRIGPAQGKASVTIDGKSKGTFDLYSASPALVTKTFSGLANKAHTIVIKVLHTKNAASSGFNVKLDAFVAGTTTRHTGDPAILYDAWKSTAQAQATDATYRSSATAASKCTFGFTGTGIDWITAKGKGYGKASATIDGVAKGTFDLYHAATAWKFHVTFTGLSAGSHTIVIQVLGQKNPSATGKTVVVDGFVVHS